MLTKKTVFKCLAMLSKVTEFAHDFDDLTVEAYHLALKGHLDDEQFEQAAGHFMTHKRTFPRPVDFVEHFRGSSKDAAIAAFERLGSIDPTRQDITDPTARRVYELLGGERRWQELTVAEFESWYKRDFLDHYQRLHKAEQGHPLALPTPPKQIGGPS